MKKTLRGKRYLRSRRTVEIGRNRRRSRKFNGIDWSTILENMNRALIAFGAKLKETDWFSVLEEIRQRFEIGLSNFNAALNNLQKNLNTSRPSSVWANQIGNPLPDDLGLPIGNDNDRTDQ